MTATELFCEVPIFAGMRREALVSLAEAAKRLEFEKSAVIVREGNTGDVMFVIEQGAVEVVKHLGEAHETVLARLHTRHFFGEMCIIECVARSASVRALELTSVYLLRSADLYRLFQKWPDQYALVILNIARDLCRRLRALDEAFSGKS